MGKHMMTLTVVENKIKKDYGYLFPIFVILVSNHIFFPVKFFQI